MTLEEFRGEVLAFAATRAESEGLTAREALVREILGRLNEAGELPDAEACSETLVGHRGRLLEIDAFAFDEADGSLHLFIALRDGGSALPEPLTLTGARDMGFGRLVGLFEQARSGWLSSNIEESRPLWALAERIRASRAPASVRLHVLTDRVVSERLRSIPSEVTREGTPVEFQIWDMSRLKRIHEAQSVRDDLVIDFSDLQQGGVPLLPASVSGDEYRAYLAVLPAEVLAAIYRRHGSRLLEGNVRTFLGRRGSTNKGITATLLRTPTRFFAYNNGISVTASDIQTVDGGGGVPIMTQATDLQIVNGAQTTASLAALQQEGRLAGGVVFVPVKISVVPSNAAQELIPQISRCANSQNRVRESDFFANHEFHRRVEEISRRVLAPAIGGSQIQTHWYYERARGQYLNDKGTKRKSERDLFERMNPRRQVVTKMDLGKVEMCFLQRPEIACRGAEKAFTEFAEQVVEVWKDERARPTYNDNWFRSAIARVIVFRATERVVSDAPWYEGGYRAQIVAYTVARLARLADERAKGGAVDYLRIWERQTVGAVLEQQLASTAQVMRGVLLAPPEEGRNISEWAKQQACCKRAMETEVEAVEGLEEMLVGRDEVRSGERAGRGDRVVMDRILAQTTVVELGAEYWRKLREFAVRRELMSEEDLRAVEVACSIPKRIPNDREVERLLAVQARCVEGGLKLESGGTG